jgi:hypothetical protein
MGNFLVVVADEGSMLLVKNDYSESPQDPSPWTHAGTR